MVEKDKLKEKACRKAHELAKEKGADYCSFGEWVVALVLEKFANGESSPITLQFEVGGVAETGKPLPCDEEYGLRLFALQQEAADDQCIEVRIRGKTVTIC